MQQRIRIHKHTTCWLWPVCLVLLSACTGTKFLAENESFYTGASIKFETHEKVGGKRALKRSLEEDILPGPNGTLLGMRPGVWFYYAAGGPKSKKGLKGWIRRKLGQEPVLLKDATPGRTAKILEGNLINNGYFESRVSSSVSTRHKKSEVTYTVQLYPPFRVRQIHYPRPQDSVYKAVIQKIQEASYLKPQQRYRLEQLKAEMERIEALLENEGFYYFDDRHLLFQADSTVGHRQVDLYLRVKPGIPQKARQIYRMNEINVISDFSFTEDTLHTAADTVQIDGYNYIDRSEKFRPRAVTGVINLERGAIYTRDAHDLTISHLMSLGAFKFVNIKYREPAGDSARLDADIYLTPLLKKSIRLEVQAVSKSNNFVGPGLGVTFTNRNFLGGSERFEFKLNTSYEVQINNRQPGTLNAFELDLETALSVPRFMSPVRINYSSTKYIPNTRFRLGFNLQKRIDFFQINSFNARYGYTWRETTTRSHEFFPVDMNFVQLNRTSAAFNQLLEDNPVLANSFQNQFIMGGRYAFTLNTQLREQQGRQYDRDRPDRHNFYLHTGLSFAGNIIRTLQKAGSAEGPYELFGQPYSQFILGDVDLRYYWQIDRHNKLATRLIVGTGYAYGNSTHLPYIKQFAVGGSNSIRAFPARSVGPGTYNVLTDEDNESNTLFVDQRGDIKLEANIEYRFDIIKSLKGAVFADAGNIWLWRQDDERPGGKLNADTFLKELAVGTGMGLRFDFRFFVLRFDLGFPLRRPDLPENERWVIDEIDFGSSTWRSDNLVFNIAIGYPF